jgi:outer membrane receptor protein involved in Fe transport
MICSNRSAAPHLLILIAALLPTALTAQQPTMPYTTVRDSVQRLKDIEVTVTRTAEPLARVPSAVGGVGKTDLRRGQPTLGLDEALNDLPGVTPAGIADFNDNRLPGVPEHFARVGFRAEPGWGIALDLDHTLSSSVFGNDSNTAKVDGWGAGVTNVRLSWNGNLGRAVARPFVAVNSLFDKRYVGSVTINGFDQVAQVPRVIEPAPGIKVYVGAEVGWRVLR